MTGDIEEEEFKIEYLKDENGNDTGVKVNGVWYSSLQSYFEKREDAYKDQVASNG